MRNKRKYKDSQNGDIVTFTFIAILVYGFVSNPAFIATAETIIKYVLALVPLVVLALLAKRIVRKVNNRVLKTVDTMTGEEFERYVAKLLVMQGYTHISLTERYDYGVDIVAEKDGIRWGIQVKRHTGLVKAIAVRQVVTALKEYGCDRAMVVSNSQFSRVAVELARSNDCVLIERKRLISWMTS